MPRLLSTLLVLGLLGGTAAAFAVTERLKLVPSPIIAPVVTEAFSPVCACETEEATIAFRLREPDRLTVTIVDSDDREVATVAEDERARGEVEFRWDGSGAQEGVYRARVHLADARRTIVIPNQIRLDATPPELTVRDVSPTVFSPDGDGRSDVVHARYAVSERASVSLLVAGEETVVTPPRGDGKIDWYARGQGPGEYELALVARDVAGNASARSAPTTVTLRFLRVAPTRVVVPAGFRFGVRVSTDAKRYRWRLGARRGSSGAELLVLRAPSRPGRYTLRLFYGDHTAAAAVFVRPRP